MDGQESSDSGQDDRELDTASGLEEETSDDVEIAHISDTACSFVRRCIQSGEHTRAMTALVNVIEMADLSTSACKQAVLLTAQILMVTSQHQASLTSIMDFYQAMPPPYSTADSCFIIARNYEMEGSLPFAQYWWKKCLGRAAAQAQVKADFCIGFAHRAFEQQDYIFAADGFAQALLYDKSRGMNSFQVTYRYLFALLAFQDPNPSTKNTRTDIAWALAQAVCSRRSRKPFRERYADEHFYLMRELYCREFLRIYNAVFAWDDKPARCISLWWKRCRRRREETHQSSPTAAPLANSTNRKKRQKKDAVPGVRSRTLERARLLRGSSKQSIRKPNKKKSSHLVLLENPDDEERRSPSNSPPRSINRSNNWNPLPAASPEALQPSPHAFLRRQFVSKMDRVERSPTKRKLRAVRNLRTKTLVDEEPTAEELNSPALLTKEPQRTEADDTSLLDLYQFQTPSSEAFEVSCGRAPGFADLDLNELENFVRLAHYRARVLQQKHKPVGSLNERIVKPDWLEHFDKVLHAVYEVSDHSKQERNPRAHLTNIHARMLDQLTKIRDLYKQKHGQTIFTRELHVLIHDLKEWKHENVAALVTAMEDVKEHGANEEKQRNLEFFHVHSRRDTTAQ